MTTNPFDFSAMMKMFDPAEVAKAFNPEQFKANLAQFAPPSVDLNAALEMNRKNFEAMRAANEAAASAYRDQYQQQMAIFEAMMEAAKQAAAVQAGPDAATRQGEIYKDAMEKAFAYMAELATAIQTANQEVIAITQARVQEAVQEISDQAKS